MGDSARIFYEWGSASAAAEQAMAEAREAEAERERARQQQEAAPSPVAPVSAAVLAEGVAAALEETPEPLIAPAAMERVSAAPVSVAAEGSSAPEGPKPPANRRPTRRQAVALGVLIPATAASVAFALGAFNSTTPAPAAPATAAGHGASAVIHAPSRDAADAAAAELAHTAQVAVETYATGHNGSYGGATAAKLRSLEPTLQTGPGHGQAYLAAGGVRVIATGRGYVLTATAVNGDTFTIARSDKGALTRTCTIAAHASSSVCTAHHSW